MSGAKKADKCLIGVEKLENGRYKYTKVSGEGVRMPSRAVIA